MAKDTLIRDELTALLSVRQAHLGFEDAVADFPLEHVNTRPPNCPYTFWHLLEHMRICQRDILEYIESENYQSLRFPDDLWPDPSALTDANGWQHTIDSLLADRQRLAEIANDPTVDLMAPLANSGSSQHTIVREIHVIAAHNSYHVGGLVMMRQVMGFWK
jgi:hypothetical protein